jgi:hypothetical protein
MFGWFKKRNARAAGPDYSHIDSREKAEHLHRKGELHELLLLPSAFGGERIPANIVYAPAFAAELKARLDSVTIMKLAREGRVTRYTATPEYEGRSVVPTRIRVAATDPGRFEGTIAIWGTAVEAGQERVSLSEAPAAPEFTLDVTTVDRFEPSEIVRNFISDYEAWNEYCNEVHTSHSESGMQAAEAAYAMLLRKYCLPGHVGQPVSFGSRSAHVSAREVIIDAVGDEETCVVRTCHSKTVGSLNMADDYEYHLKRVGERWYLTSVLYVDEEGKYEGL